MKLTWIIEGHGSGTTELADADEAGRALRAALTACWPEVTPEHLVRLLGPVRAALVTDGRYAVEHGDTWSIQRAGLVVTLSP